MNAVKDALRTDRGALESALKEAGAIFVKPNSIKCCFHEDKNPSGSVYQGEDGAWRFKCHGCGFCEDVIGVKAKAAGKRSEDVLRELNAQPTPTEPRRKVRFFPTLDALKSAVEGLEACYVYTDPATRKPQMVVIRRTGEDGRKSFIQCRPDASGFVMSSPPKPWPIYNRTRIAPERSVVVVEGEKCVHALADVGIAATTSPGGAGKAALADWSPLAGKKVLLWPDADTPDPETKKCTGVDHMREVADLLEKLDPPASVYWVDPELLDLPPKGDVVEFLSLFGGETKADKRKAVEAILGIANPLGASAELGVLLEDAIAGRRRSLPWPWPSLGRLSKSLLPATVTIIGGDPGSTKSFLVLEAGMFWFKHDFKPAIYELEEDVKFHLNRALAQLDNNSDLTDPDWVRTHPEETRAAYARHKDFLNGFARCLYAAPDEQMTLDGLVGWVRERAKAGCQIIAIDPITAAAVTDKPWIDDLKFLMAVKTVARQYDCRIVLVTHPRKGKRFGASLDDLAGGAAYPRFSQTVFWVEQHDDTSTTLVEGVGMDGRQSVHINREIQIRKARNGRGAGLSVGFVFEGATLRFKEMGLLVKE